MTEDAKKQAADAAADEKGQAQDEQKPNESPVAPDEVAEGEVVDTKTETGNLTGSEDSEKTDANDEKKIESNEEVETHADTDDSVANGAGADEKKSEDDPERPEGDPKQSEDSDTEEASTEPKTDSENAKTKADNVPRKATVEAKTSQDFQAEIRDQIENCKFEIVAALQESVHDELKNVMHGQLRKVERRRTAGVIIRDIVILLLAVAVGYFGYRLYEYGYFDFVRPQCNQTDNCQSSNDHVDEPGEPEEVKDLAWYRKNYGDLLSNLQTHLSADKVSAYYLYSGDYKVTDIQPEYLLSMAYNQLLASTNYADNSLTVTADSMRGAFINTFGTADYYNKRNFTYDCHEFTYDKISDTFSAPDLACTDEAKRVILEEITDIYEEGNVLYFLTVATVYDRVENTYYTFDNLFRPAITNVEAEDLLNHVGLLNQYQYQFKRTDDRYYFSGVTKLK